MVGTRLPVQFFDMQAACSNSSRSWARRCIDCLLVRAFSFVPSCVTIFKLHQLLAPQHRTRFVNNPSSRSRSSIRKSESVCALISVHPVSQRRPGSHAGMRDNARADATPMAYPYSQIAASKRGGKQGRPAPPSRAAIPSSQALESQLAGKLPYARADVPAESGFHIHCGQKCLPSVDARITRLPCSFASGPAADVVIHSNLRPLQTKVQSNALETGSFLSPVREWFGIAILATSSNYSWLSKFSQSPQDLLYEPARTVIRQGTAMKVFRADECRQKFAQREHIGLRDIIGCHFAPFIPARPVRRKHKAAL